MPFKSHKAEGAGRYLDFTPYSVMKAGAVGNKRTEWIDAKGSGLRRIVQPIRKEGKTFVKSPGSWAVRGRLRGRMKKITLPEGLSIDEAREKAIQTLNNLKRGIDPSAEKIAEKAKDQTGESVANLLPLFMEYHASHVSPGTAKRDAEKLGLRESRDTPGKWVPWKDGETGAHTEVMKEWGTRAARDLTEQDAHLLYDKIKSRIWNGKKVKGVSANHVNKLVKEFGEWARSRGYIETDPFASIKKKPTKETPRERALSALEIVAFWRACDRLGYPFGRIGQMTLLTGARPGTGNDNERGEVLSALWAEINPKERSWKIPKERTKTSREYVSWLSDGAMALLEALPSRGKSPYLFPAIQTFQKKNKPPREVIGVKPVAKQSRKKRELDKLMIEELRRIDPKAKFQPWQWRDLRRTAYTLIQSLGFDTRIAGAVAHHVEADRIVATYGQYKFERDKRRAVFALWSFVELLLNAHRFLVA